MKKARILLRALAACMASPGLAPGQVPLATHPISFEVASVRPVERTPGPKTKREDDARVEYRQEVAFNLLLRAYGLRAYQVSGPSWIKDHYYDVIATLPKGATKADIPGMLQHLLTDRFQLSIHREYRATPVYLLTAGKEGLKLEPCKVAENGKPRTLRELAGGLEPVEPGECPANRVVTRGESTMLVETSNLSKLANYLEDGSDRPVLDKTGLEGHFRIAFECAQAMGIPEDTLGLPSMSAALQKLGLRLEAARADIEYLVVDKGDKIPTGN